MSNFIKKHFDLKYICIAVALIIFLSASLLVVFSGLEMSQKNYSPTEQTVNKEESKKEEEKTKPSLPVQDENFDLMKIEESQLHCGELILVNNQNECLIDGTDLLGIMENKNDTYKTADYLEQLNRVALNHLNTMMSDFYNFAGATDVYVSCGYRSRETQQSIFDNTVATSGLEHAQKYVNKPGFSEHQTGYAFDFALLTQDGQILEFTGEGEYAWIKENCAKYGYILRYSEMTEDVTGISAETWHFRYVGQPHAEYIMSKGIALEAYLTTLEKDHSKDNPLELKCTDGSTYYTYYEKLGDDNTINVPKNKGYSISGDNNKGIIVTYK